MQGPWDVWEAHRRGEPIVDADLAPEQDADADPDPSDPLERGTRWEARVREEASVYMRRPVLRPGEPFGAPDDIVIVRSAAHPWISASPDGWIEEDGVLVPVELKTDAKRGHKWGRSGTIIRDYEKEGGEAIVPLHYALQVSWQLSATGAPYGYIAVLLGSYDLRWFRLELDPRASRQVVRLVSEWRARHLIGSEVPDRDASDACIAYYMALHRGRSEGARAATDEEAGWIDLLVARKDAEKAAAEGRSGLLATMGDLKSLYLPRGPAGQPRGVSRSKAGALTVYGF